MDIISKFAKKPKILCLHGHAASAKILEAELQVWPEFVLEKMDLIFIDAPFPVEEQTSLFGPPYFEWFHYNQDLKKYKNFDECIAYIEECMVELGPFDGILGFSQGGLLSAALPGMQREGVALTKVPKIKFVIIISGGKFGGIKFPSPELARNAFSSPIDIPSLHIIGEKEPDKESHFELLESYVNPTLLYHHEGHIVPHLDESGVKIVLGFLDRIQRLMYEKSNTILSKIRNCLCGY